MPKVTGLLNVMCGSMGNKGIASEILEEAPPATAGAAGSTAGGIGLVGETGERGDFGEAGEAATDSRVVTRDEGAGDTAAEPGPGKRPLASGTPMMKEPPRDETAAWGEAASSDLADAPAIPRFAPRRTSLPSS